MIPSTRSMKIHITRVNGWKIQCVKCVVKSFKQNKYWKDMKIECITCHCNLNCNIIVQMKSCFNWGQNIFTNCSWTFIWLVFHFFLHVIFLNTWESTFFKFSYCCHSHCKYSKKCSVGNSSQWHENDGPFWTFSGLYSVISLAFFRPCWPLSLFHIRSFLCFWTHCAQFC